MFIFVSFLHISVCLWLYVYASQFTIVILKLILICKVKRARMVDLTNQRKNSDFLVQPVKSWVLLILYSSEDEINSFIVTAKCNVTYS